MRQENSDSHCSGVLPVNALKFRKKVDSLEKPDSVATADSGKYSPNPSWDNRDC